MRPTVMSRPSKVLSAGFPTIPKKENTPEKKSNSLNKIVKVMITGINRIKPCIK
jgi:hypothetical protein